MNKIIQSIITGIICTCSFFAFSAVDDTVFMVKTTGTQVYSDFTKVGDSGTYAVTWTSSTNSFAGFNADGTLVDPENSKILAEMPSRNSKLKPFLLQVDKNYVSGGTYQLSLLDTRVRNKNTGILEDSNSSTNVRSYVELVSDFKYSQQFSTMCPAEGSNAVTEASFKTAAGFRDTAVEPDFSDPDALNEYVAAAGVDVSKFDAVNFKYSFTNAYSIVDSVNNTVTKYYDVYRFFDIVDYLVITNISEQTVLRYKDVYITNYVDIAETKQSMPESVFAKTSTYSGFAINGTDAYVVTIKTYKPNAYGLMHASFRTKIGRKTYTKYFYGMVDDDGVLTAYGNADGCKLVFAGRNVDGTIVLNGVKYTVTGEFLK